MLKCHHIWHVESLFPRSSTKTLEKILHNSNNSLTFASLLRFVSHRDVAQLVAYYVRDVGVASSNLVIPTFKGIGKKT